MPLNLASNNNDVNTNILSANCTPSNRNAKFDNILLKPLQSMYVPYSSGKKSGRYEPRREKAKAEFNVVLPSVNQSRDEKLEVFSPSGHHVQIIDEDLQHLSTFKETRHSTFRKSIERKNFSVEFPSHTEVYAHVYQE